MRVTKPMVLVSSCFLLAAVGSPTETAGAEDQKVKWWNDMPQATCVLPCDQAPECDCAEI